MTRLSPHVATIESASRSYSGSMTGRPSVRSKSRFGNAPETIVRSTSRPNAAVTRTPATIATGRGAPVPVATSVVAYAPTMMNSPWARLMTPMMPKMMASPAAASTMNAKLSRN